MPPRSPLGKGTASTRRGNLDIATKPSTAELSVTPYIAGLHVKAKRLQASKNMGTLPRRGANSYTLTMVQLSLSLALLLSVHSRLAGPIIAALLPLVDVTHHSSPLRKKVMFVQNQPASLSAALATRTHPISSPRDLPLTISS